MIGSTRKGARAAALATIAVSAMLATSGATQAIAAGNPEVHVTLVGAKVRKTTNATFKISKSPVLSALSCHMDSNKWSPCGAVKTVSRMSNGKHTLYVRAAAGATIRTASAQVWVDTLAPHTPQIANQSGGPTNAAYQPVVSTAVRDNGVAGGVHYQYRTSRWAGTLNPFAGHCGTYGPAKAAPSNRIVKISATGITCVGFRAEDAAGNLSGWGGSYIVIIDRTAPSKAELSGFDQEWHPQITLTAHATDTGTGVSYYKWFVSKNAGAFAYQSTVYQGHMTFTAHGVYQVKVVAFDAAGNHGLVSNIATIHVGSNPDTN